MQYIYCSGGCCVDISATAFSNLESELFSELLELSMFGLSDWVCEFGGLERWNGTVEWTTGVEYWTGLLECHAHYVSSMVTSHECSNTAVTHSSVRTVIASSAFYLVILVTASACMGCSIFDKSLAISYSAPKG